MSALWKERPEAGSPLALQLVLWLAFRVGRAAARALLYPTTLYFLLRRGPERRASLQFLSRIRARPAHLYHAYRHFLYFSHAALDRLYLVTERFRRYEIKCFGLAELDRALEGGRGVFLVGAHLGSFEALRVLSLERPEVPVRILLDLEQSPTVSRILNALNPRLAATVINVRAMGPTVSIALKQALDSNAIIALLADRAMPGQATQSVQFLGKPAKLPTGPWLLAAALNVPVILAFGLYRGGSRYELYFETFADNLPLSRNERHTALTQILQRFADRLAHYARLAPYNWFNFYDFWHDPTHSDPAAGTGDLPRRVRS